MKGAPSPGKPHLPGLQSDRTHSAGLPVNDPNLTPVQRDRIRDFLDEESPGAPPSEDTAVAPGDEVGGCVVRAFLGRGGMGEVYLATRKATGETVALKVLRAFLLGSPKLVDRFLREAHLASRIRHPNVIAVLGAGSANGLHFHVLEYVEGRSLAQRLSVEPQLPVLEVLDLAEQVAAGLGAAHALDIVHRDIKPGNLLVARDGTVKVADFGLARHLLSASLTTKGRRLGTVYFMPPEQINGDEVDARADLYALGATLYTALAGRMPFAGADAAETLRLVLSTPPAPLARLVPGLPRALDGLIVRLLEKSPERRPASAAEVLDALCAARAATPVPAGWRRWTPFGGSRT